MVHRTKITQTTVAKRRMMKAKHPTAGPIQEIWTLHYQIFFITMAGELYHDKQELRNPISSPESSRFPVYGGDN